ncbi:DUF3788 domain-containing protein [Acetatifactor muris]|uniref:DUF3788 domain-containing protein n=1 Tax=Acetatifactor muris TaxID=879566 RepID=A0A2K4ZJ85_9FIRM|nr:DUF3788 domain-containing protein [Acetatifactor muris]MCR2048892.1 DUF3788 domain-containing protein [Acetatifactor muris]SOY30521.1 hypothetical protein AMURIS_03252 [Acetatifactor muris]
MYERMLDKLAKPIIEEMAVFCGENAERFSLLNEWLASVFHTDERIVFPYGNHYGWGVSHKVKNKLICNIFAEDNAFTVMMRLSDRQYQTVYSQLQEYARGLIDNKYSCGDGGWIHYRVTEEEQFDDIKTLLAVKCSPAKQRRTE